MTNLKLLSLGNCKDCTGSLSSLAGLTSLGMLKLEGVFSLKEAAPYSIQGATTSNQLLLQYLF